MAKDEWWDDDEPENHISLHSHILVYALCPCVT